jgi:poly-gamma-glutamate system protein
MVELLSEAGLKRGDVIGVALSGSFPALNVATLVAAETLGLKAIVVSSISASMFGANRPELTWLDMEAALAESGITRTRSVAATLGAKDDNGAGLPKVGRRLLRQAAERNGVPLLRTRSLRRAIRTRLRLYREHAGPLGLKAYVNVGGGRASVGSRRTKAQFEPGLNLEPPQRIDQPGVMSILSQRGLPVIHLGNIRKLCTNHGLIYLPTA